MVFLCISSLCELSNYGISKIIREKQKSLERALNAL